jgi:hypothetical protein
MRLCESKLLWAETEIPCPHKASWVVRIGDRHTDEQLSCSVHLPQTCSAMIAAEGRLPRPAATVRKLLP